MTRNQNRRKFFLVSILVACALLLFWVSGHKPQEKKSYTRVSGVVHEVIGSTPKAFVPVLARVQSDMRVFFNVPIPKAMLRKGTVEPLDREQQELYKLLTLFFGQGHPMVSVAACESSLRHRHPDGKLNVSDDGEDQGAFQIRRSAHRAEYGRRSLVMDDVTHNVAYATYLFRERGLRDWVSSQSCWEKLRFIYEPNT